MPAQLVLSVNVVILAKRENPVGTAKTEIKEEQVLLEPVVKWVQLARSERRDQPEKMDTKERWVPRVFLAKPVKLVAQVFLENKVYKAERVQLVNEARRVLLEALVLMAQLATKVMRVLKVLPVPRVPSVELSNLKCLVLNPDPKVHLVRRVLMVDLVVLVLLDLVVHQERMVQLDQMAKKAQMVRLVHQELTAEMVPQEREESGELTERSVTLASLAREVKMVPVVAVDLLEFQVTKEDLVREEKSEMLEIKELMVPMDLSDLEDPWVTKALLVSQVLMEHLASRAARDPKAHLALMESVVLLVSMEPPESKVLKAHLAKMVTLDQRAQWDLLVNRVKLVPTVPQVNLVLLEMMVMSVRLVRLAHPVIKVRWAKTDTSVQLAPQVLSAGLDPWVNREILAQKAQLVKMDLKVHQALLEFVERLVLLVLMVRMVKQAKTERKDLKVALEPLVNPAKLDVTVKTVIKVSWVKLVNKVQLVLREAKVLLESEATSVLLAHQARLVSQVKWVLPVRMDTLERLVLLVAKVLWVQMVNRVLWVLKVREVPQVLQALLLLI